MKEIVEIRRVINKLTRIEFISKSGPDHYIDYETVNGRFTHVNEYQEWILNCFEIFKDLLDRVILNSNKFVEEEHFRLIYDHLISSRFIKHDIDSLLAFRKELETEYGSNYVAPHEFELDCTILYSKIKPTLVKYMIDIANVKHYGVKGINVDSDVKKIKSAYALLVAYGLVEPNMEDRFILSLTGKQILSHVKWLNGATLARFFKGLIEVGIPFDSQDGKGIKWSRVIQVFPLDINNKKMSKNIGTFTKSKSFSKDDIMDKVISILE